MNLIDKIKDKSDLFEEYGFSVRQHRYDPPNVIHLVSNVELSLPTFTITEYADGIIVREVRHIFKETPDETIAYLTEILKKD